MNQRQVILAVVAVGLVSAALFAWRMTAEDADTTQPPAAAHQTPATPFGPASTHVASSEPAAAPAPATPPPAATAESTPAVPEVSQTAAPAPVDVDTPEPAERKFARGGRPEPEQN